MMDVAISVLALMVFLVALFAFKIGSLARDAIREAHLGISAIQNDGLSEEKKERIVRSSALTLMGIGGHLFWRFVVSFVIAVAPVYVADIVGLVSMRDIVSLMLQWEYFVVTSLVVGVAALLWGWLSKKGARYSNYSVADRLLHKIAFSQSNMQLVAAGIEERVFAKKINNIREQPPIFITSLPRAGTTILLSALNDLPMVGTHLYRDMPFIMAPLLWSRMSLLFSRECENVERAHHDGVKISCDAPEAFEEVIWRNFWPHKYHDDNIELWHVDDVNKDAAEFFVKHFKKIVALRTDGVGRYVSKNNNNIARLGLLPEMFPGCQVVVPIREPAEHAASLYRQHKNFFNQHLNDAFTARYMRDIGHMEFGALHTPFSFPGFDYGSGSPDELDYWLEYWISAYRLVLEQVDRLYILSHSKVTENPEVVMRSLCERLNLEQNGVDFARRFKPIRKKAMSDWFESKKLAEANDIYNALRHYAL